MLAWLGPGKASGLRLDGGACCEGRCGRRRDAEKSSLLSVVWESRGCTGSRLIRSWLGGRTASAGALAFHAFWPGTWAQRRGGWVWVVVDGQTGSWGDEGPGGCSNILG